MSMMLLVPPLAGLGTFVAWFMWMTFVLENPTASVEKAVRISGAALVLVEIALFIVTVVGFLRL